MINNIIITNHLDESITMELRFPEKSGFLVRNIDGLGPSKANINITELTSIDGALFNSARTMSRNIVFSFEFLENPTIEDTRHNSYKYFPIKERIKIQVETDKRTCEVYGYVESNDPVIFSKKEGCAISIICPDAYLYGSEINETIYSKFEALFEFPFSNESLVSNLLEMSTLSVETTKNIYYSGDAASGIVIHIHANGLASGFEMINIKTSGKISIDSAKLITLTGADISTGDDIIISTVKGDKYATLIREGTEINIFNTLNLEDIEWFQLVKGDNLIGYTADSGLSNLNFKIDNLIIYEGV